MTSRLFVVAASLALPAAASAQPILDGIVDAGFYGPGRAFQDTATGFGDSTLGLIDFANGSELDGAFGRVHNGTVYIVLTGNLESNFNKLDLFVDSIPGGQNRIRGDNPDVDFDALGRMGDDGSGNGLRFDTGFDADFYITFTGGDTGGGVYQTFASYAEMLTKGGGVGLFLGSGGAGAGAVLEGANGIRIAINNSNTAGVTADSADGAADVTTGIELAIPLSVIGSPTGAFRITALINGVGHDFLSNQVLGGVGGLPNLGEPRTVDFSAIAGDQFFVIPAPGAASLLALTLLAAGRRRR